MMMKKSKEDTPTSLSWYQRSHLILRGRKKKRRSIRGKLRIRSFPGMFLVLGVVVVVVGTTLAIVGYWPFRLPRSSIMDAAEKGSISESQSSGWALLSSAGLAHSDRMKLLGPVIMGIGLFILICANTVLYENRDRETQMLLAQMRSVLCSVSAAVPSADLKEMVAANAMTRHCQWVSSLPAAHINILCLQQTARSEPLLRTGRGSEEEGRGSEEEGRGSEEEGGGVQKTEALHHHKSESPTRPSPQPETEHLSQVRVDARLPSYSSLLALQRTEADAPTAPPRRCHSVSHRTRPVVPSHGGRLWDTPLVVPPLGGVAEPWSGLGSVPGLVGHGWPRVCSVGGRWYQSWPRACSVGGRRYLELENTEDAVDRVLEQQSSLFGSGAFQ